MTLRPEFCFSAMLKIEIGVLFTKCRHCRRKRHRAMLSNALFARRSHRHVAQGSTIRVKLFKVAATLLITVRRT